MGEITAQRQRTVRTIGSWIKLIGSAFVTLGTVAGVLFGIYSGWKELKEGNEINKSLTEGAYAAMASKIEALSLRVAYLEGRIDSKVVTPIRMERPAPPVSAPPTETPDSDGDGITDEEPATQLPFKDGVKFKIQAYQELPTQLRDLVQYQGQYLAE